MTRRVLISCEHAGNRVPRWLRTRFVGAEAALASHRGWDPGTLPIAEHLATTLDAPLFATTTSRLVVDTNRSVGHPRLFSEWTRDGDRQLHARILAEYYHPHRAAIEGRCRDWIDAGDGVLHLGIHSFTPVLDGVERHTDLALLYDPQRSAEARFAARWLERLAQAAPELRLRRNFPYRGAADGLTTSLRRTFPVRAYCGIEVEVCQALSAIAASRRRIARLLAETLPAA